MSHTALRREFSDLIELDASVDRLASGFTFTEGPIWHPRDQYLLFSDMPADVRRRYDERGGVREVTRPSNKCNGMTYDANPGLIVCEHARAYSHAETERQLERRNPALNTVVMRTALQRFAKANDHHPMFLRDA